jgi:hypothetical protein
MIAIEHITCCNRTTRLTHVSLEQHINLTSRADATKSIDATPWSAGEARILTRVARLKRPDVLELLRRIPTRDCVRFSVCIGLS